MSFIKKVASFALSATMITSAFTGLGVINSAESTVDAATVEYGLAQTSQEGVILHCWNWSYNNIKKYMKDIAAAGYTSVQTSPVQQPKDYYWEGVAYGEVGIPDGTGDADHGNWWKAYQPVTFSICDNGHTWYGTKAEFKAMCDEAEKYGVRVIVDIVANHMGNIQGWKIGDEETVMGDISPQVGEFWNPDMLTDPSYWHISTSWTHSSDGRFDVTQGNGGMPDLNTGDSKVQQMVLNLLNECIDCGADGFRFDMAKHIETPVESPYNGIDFSSDFWDVVLDGARAHYKQVNGYDGVYFYGETLNRLDDSTVEAYYRSKMSLTDNSTSDNIRNSVKYKQASGAAQSGYCGYIAGEADKAVLWAESHDTYMGGGSSYDCTDSDIKKTWAMVASRKDATALFFARPYYSKYILAGDQTSARQSDEAILAQTDYTQMGDVGTLTWADPSVVAVNRFHNFFIGQSEKIGSSGEVAYNVRGNTGIVISKMDGPGSVSLSVGMKDGTYTDQVTGNKFTVSGGVLKGTVASDDGVAVIYNPTKDYGTVSPVEPTVVKISADTESGASTFTDDSINVTMKAENAVSATYETSEGAKGTFTSSKTITVGSTISAGETVSVTITATAADGTVKTKTYTYTKKGARTGYPKLNAPGIVFDNEAYGWSKVYAYVYADGQGNNGAWPGVAMTEVDGDYWTYELDSKFTGTVNVIFSNGSGVQIPGASKPGLEMGATEKKLFINDSLVDLPEAGDDEEELVNNSTISATSITYGNTITFTGKASGGTSPYQYRFAAKHSTASSYTILKDYNNTTTKVWRPTKTGTYTVLIRAKDSTGKNVAKTFTLKVTAASALANNSTISATSITYGNTITFTGKASGGTSPYQYRFAAKHSTASSYTILKDYNNTTTKVWRPTKTGTYTVLIRAKDSTGKNVAKTFTLKVTAASALANNSTISATSITYGNTITFTGKASGGTSPYQYRFAAKHSTASSYTILKDYNNTTTKVWRPTKTGTYTVLIRAKDSTGKNVAKTFTLKVTAASALANNSTISATSITYGNTITFTGKASGGTSPYQYRFAAKHSTAYDYTILKDYNDTTTKVWRPTKTGTYTVLIRAKDSTGKNVAKTYTITVR